MKTLNYIPHAIEDLRMWEAKFKTSMPKASKNITWILDLLDKAIKFYLPDGGIVFDDELRALPSSFRLPYPVVAAEFSVSECEMHVLPPIAAAGERTYSSSRRIALAFESEKDNGNFEIGVIPIYYSDNKKRWLLPPYGVSIVPHREKWSQEISDMMLKVHGGSFKHGLKPIDDISLFPFPLISEAAIDLELSNTPEYIAATVETDNRDESVAIMSLIEVLSCNNVSTETIAAPRALNKKRIAKGKPPLYEYKILTLDPGAERHVEQNSSKGTHASPRVHLRRGHIRRLPNKNIWVNATVVGNRKQGMVVKDYAVKSSVLQPQS